MAKLALVYASHWPLHLKEELSAFRTRLESLRSVLHSNRTVKPHPSPVPNAMSSALKTRKSNGGANATATANTTGNRDRPGKVYRRAMRMGGGAQTLPGRATQQLSLFLSKPGASSGRRSTIRCPYQV